MRKIALCKFDPIKYGHSLSVDVVDVESFRNYLWENPIYGTNYYSIYLITHGVETLEVDGKSESIHPGVVVCSRPVEIWHWEKNTQQDGMYLYWTEDFLNSFFKDPHFINSFSFFQIGRSHSFLHPDAQSFERLLTLFNQMREEIKSKEKDKAQHILRAMVYETLMLLERVNNIPNIIESNSKRTTHYIQEFQKIAQTYYKKEHNVEFYAEKLYITSNYLNKIVRQSLGVSTKQYLSQLLYQEAENLLKYTSITINNIAEELNLDTAYFIKKFKQLKNVTPLQYRNDCIEK